MKINFCQALKALTGDDIQELGLESAILKKASELIPNRTSWTLVEAAKVLDENGIKFSDILVMKGPQFTFGAICADVLVSRIEDKEDGVDGRELIRRFKLASRVFRPKEEEGPVTVSSEEVVLIRRLIVKAKERYSVLITGQALAMLDDSEETKE